MPRARVLVPARVSRARLCRPGDARGARPRRADGVDIAMARAARAIAARRAIVSFVWSSRVQYTIKYTHVYIALCESPSRAGPGGNDARAKRRSRDDAGIAARDVRGDDARASDARDATSHRDARDGDNARASVNGSARRDGRATRARRTRAVGDDARGGGRTHRRRVGGGRCAQTRAREKTDDDDDDDDERD